MKRRKTRDFDAEAFFQKAVADYAPEELKKKQIIFSQGEPAHAVYYIQKGRVRLSAVSTNGKEATLALMGAGDFVGEECVSSSHTLRLTTATAISDGSMIVIQKSTMITLLKTHGFSEMFVAFLLSRNARFQEALVDQLFNSSEKRLARVLLQLAQVGKEGTPEAVVPKVSQEMLAEMVGTTRAR
jgi:CRP-like cAMP-binding protein